MEFNLIRPDKLKVSLNRQEMDMFGITRGKFDYSNQANRRALISILEEGRAQTGFSPRRARLYIEAYPCVEGGCVVYYTKLATGEAFAYGVGAAGPRPVVFAFPDADSLLRACTGALKQYGHRIYKSSLFKMREGYRLIVLPLDYTDGLSVDFLREFGDLTGEGAVSAAFTEEHGKPLCMDNAIETLARLDVNC